MENQNSILKAQGELDVNFEAQRFNISGIELEEVLKAYGMTQKEFGVAIGKSRVTVCRMINEARKIKLRYAQILEKAVGSPIYTMVISQYREKKARRLEHEIKYRAVRMDAERLKQEKKELARQKKLEMSKLSSKKCE